MKCTAAALVLISMCTVSAKDGESAQSENIDIKISRSAVIDLAAGFRRVSVANPEIAEAVAITTTELVVNGKGAGDTTLLVWDLKGDRHTYLLHVSADQQLVDAVRAQLNQEVGPDATLTVEGPTVFLNGTVKSDIEADRAAAIASAIPGTKIVNLLRVPAPAAQPQIMLKVRFADVNRSLSEQFGVNLFGLNPKGVGSSTTGQFGAPPNITQLGSQSGAGTLSDYLNIFFYRPDLNLGAVLQDLAARNIIQILAEPNLLTLSGHPASFLAGGEFPFPTIQGGAAGLGQITIQFKEFGIRLNFIPTLTPRGTIHLTVMPEVSALDYSNGLAVSGYTVPALATKRVTTDVELQSGQSFAIAGLLDNQLTQNIDKMPGFASIPVLGKLFTSRSTTKSNEELLVVVTPELVRPINSGEPVPTVAMPNPFSKGDIPTRLGNPADARTPEAHPVLTIEELKALEAAEAASRQSSLNVGGTSGTSGNLGILGNSGNPGVSGSSH